MIDAEIRQIPNTTIDINDNTNLSYSCQSEHSHCATMSCRVCTKIIFKCQAWTAKLLTIILVVICLTARATEIIEKNDIENGTYKLSNCKVVVDEPCPHPDINFYLYTRKRPEYPQLIHIGDSIDTSNITNSDFDYRLPTKIIIHGYNSDMFLGALVDIKRQYLRCCPHNIIFVDWEKLAEAPCYLTALYNIRQVGRCTAQLINRLKDLGAIDIHAIGFSLGAHVPNYVAHVLKPYIMPRITGLDPAMPGFTFVSKDHKLDPSDAEFVDVIHTNAFIQGKIEESGHVDFYMNGGVIQPGCWVENRFFACNHHRAPIYFAESITSNLGFWGWPCTSYFMYLLGRCPPKEPQILAGEHVSKSARGMHLVITGSVSPYAVGKYTGPTIEIIKDTENPLNSTLLNKMKNIAKYKYHVLNECTDADDFMDVFTPSSDFDDDIRINKPPN